MDLCKKNKETRLMAKGYSQKPEIDFMRHLHMWQDWTQLELDCIGYIEGLVAAPIGC